MQYSELKQWFKENESKLPTEKFTAYDGTVYLDVKWTANLFIETTDKLIKELGPAIKNSKQAQHNKNGLHRLYTHLNYTENE